MNWLCVIAIGLAVMTLGTWALGIAALWRVAFG